MTAMTHRIWLAHLARLLSFPVTTFRSDGSLDPVAYRENIEWVIATALRGFLPAAVRRVLLADGI